MGKSNSRNVTVGIFVVVGTLLLVATLYYIGKRQHLFSTNMELYSVFENVNGLQRGNNVRYSGINVGTVSKIEMVGEGNIVIQMLVEEKTGAFIKRDAVVSIGSDGLVGSMVVNIIAGKSPEARAVISGDTIESYSRIGADDMLSTLNTTNENAALLTADLLKITNKIIEGKGTLGTLVSDTLMAENIKETMAELKNTTQGTAQMIARIDRIISKINYDESAAAVILSDTASASQLKRVFANLEQSSEDINEVTRSVNEYLEEIKSGRGAIYQVTQDEDFAKDIDSTLQNVKEAAEKLNLNMEAMRHNFFFRGYFRKLDRQERRERENE